MKRSSPTQVFMHVDGNTINPITAEESLTDGIIEVRDGLLRESVWRFFVREILPKGDPTRTREAYLTVDCYNDRMKVINLAVQGILVPWLINFFIGSAFCPTPLVNGRPCSLYVKARISQVVECPLQDRKVVVRIVDVQCQML